jgi:long-chain acyl-CoA synthetase
MMRDDTFPKLLMRRYEEYGDKRIAMREKDRGIWKTYTWKDSYEKVRYFSLGLMSLGLQRGDKVAILGENTPQWYWADLAVQSAGGISVGIFPDCMPQEVKYYASFSDSKFVLAHDEEQVDKVLEIKDELPLVEKIIYWDPKGLWLHDETCLMSFDSVLDLGMEYEKEHPNIFEENVEKGVGEDVSLMVYTSGTTGLPKAAMISHNNILKTSKVILKIEPVYNTDKYVSSMSPAWIAEHGQMAAHLLTGMQVCFPEDPETAQDDIREIGPELNFMAPRQLEGMSRMNQAKILDTSPIKRFLYNLFLPVAYKYAKMEIDHEEIGWFSRLAYRLGDFIVFRNIRDKMGYLHTRLAMTGGSALSPDIIRFFHGIGVNLLTGYGSSEAGVSLCRQTTHEVKLETAGTPWPGIEIKIDVDGQLLIRGAGVFKGYYKKSSDANKILPGGWYQSGDFCLIDQDGHLVVMSRMEDVRKILSGKQFSPDYCEIRLRFSPYLKDALVFGRANEEDVVAIITIDKETVGRWAERRHIAYTTFTDLSQKHDVLSLLEGEIKEVNKVLPEHARIRRFVSLNKEFDPDELELTRTRKLRRTFVEQRFKETIDGIYSGKPEITIHSEITYRDGRKGTLETILKVHSIEVEATH